MSEIDDAIEGLQEEIDNLLDQAEQSCTSILESIYDHGNPGQQAMMDNDVEPASDDWFANDTDTWPDVDPNDYYDGMMTSHDAAPQALSELIGHAAQTLEEFIAMAQELQLMIEFLQTLQDALEALGGFVL